MENNCLFLNSACVQSTKLHLQFDGQKINRQLRYSISQFSFSILRISKHFRFHDFTSEDLLQYMTVTLDRTFRYFILPLHHIY